MTWKRLDRKTIYDTKYLKVYEDKVEFPNGNVSESYSVFRLPDVVIVLASDKEKNIITLLEYKYGANEKLRNFPAGHIEEGEEAVAAARRELLEETGYGGGEFSLVGSLKEFPTKSLSTAYIIRATDVEKIADQNLDENEEVSVVLVSKQELEIEIRQRKWIDAKCLAGITLTHILDKDS